MYVCLFQGIRLGFEVVCERWMGGIEGGDLMWIDFEMMKVCGKCVSLSCPWSCSVLVLF